MSEIKKEVYRDLLNKYKSRIEDGIEGKVKPVQSQDYTEFKKEISINSENFDVLQVIEVPIDKQIAISAEGTGEAIIQNVLRYNLPEAQEAGQIFKISVNTCSVGFEKGE